MAATHVSVTASDGAHLATWSHGASGTPAVILIHGFSLDHTTWDPVATVLTESGCQVITTDLRGHGQSTLGSDPPTLGRLVLDLKETMSALDVEEAHMVGHSLGAVIVLAARADGRLQGSIKTVTSLAGTERSVQNPVMKLGARLFSSSLGIALLQRRRPGRIMISTWFGKKPGKEQLDSIRLLSASCPPATRSAVAESMDDVDLRSTFSLSDPPVLVVCGEHDQATPLKVSKRIAAAIPGAELIVMERVGHMAMIEDSPTLSAALVDWISAHE